LLRFKTDPDEKGTESHYLYSDNINKPCFKTDPDEKGTERTSCHSWTPPAARVSRLIPMKRELKVGGRAAMSGVIQVSRLIPMKRELKGFQNATGYLQVTAGFQD